MSTETSPLVLLMSQGTVALGKMLKVSVNCKGELSCCPIAAVLSACLRAQQRGLGDSQAYSIEGRCELIGVIMCYYSGWSSGCLHFGSQYRLSCVGLEKAFQRTWPYCRNGHHFTVQHLRFSVEESAGLALLETVSGGLLWSVKPG